MDQSILQCSYSLWKEMAHKPLKDAAENFFPVCMLLVQLASMNAFYSS